MAELSEFLGIQTNNYAEYHGLLGVLKWSVEHNVKRLTVVSDSELMVKQMQGKYAVKSPVLKPLFEEARKLSRRIESFEMRHTLRGGNRTADRLANEAMDRGMGKSREQGTGIRDQEHPPAVFSARPGGATNGPNPMLGKPQPAIRPTAQATPYPVRQTLEGYVKDGVVHLLGGELPDGIFVKVIRE